MSGSQSIPQAIGLVLRAVQILESNQHRDAASATATSSTAENATLPRAPVNPSGNLLASSSTPLRTPNLSLGPQPTLISEMRQSFQPAQFSRRTPANRVAVSRPRPESTPPRQTRIEKFVQTFFCLKGPKAKSVPSAQENVRLQTVGLGQSALELEKGYDVFRVEEAIRQHFPKLEGHEFEIMRASHGGQGSAALIRVSLIDRVPNGMMLFKLRVTTYYIRPLSVLSTEDVSEDNEDVGEQGNSAADLARTRHRSSTVVTGDSNSGDPAIDLSSTQAPEVVDISDDEASASSQFQPESSDYVELKDFRVSSFAENPGQQDLMVVRSSFDEELMYIYKDPAFSFKKKLYVKFMGELGRDVNALTREFFTLAAKSIKETKFMGKYILLEGNLDHLLPNPNPMLLSQGLFTFLGKLIGHAVLQTGVGFIGLSPGVVSYMLQNNKEPFVLQPSVQDIPDPEKREMAQLMVKLIEGESLTLDQMESISSALQNCGMYENVTRGNAQLLLQQFLEFEIYYSRSSCLEQIVEGLKDTGVFEFLQTHQHLRKLVFPTERSIKYKPADILPVVTFRGQFEEWDTARAVIESFILSLSPPKIRKLLQAWTGWPVLPDEGLEVKFSPGASFCFHACLSQLEICPAIDDTVLLDNLNRCISFGYYGFGEG